MTSWIACPRCERQTMDKGSCNLCGSVGYLDAAGDRIPLATALGSVCIAFITLTRDKYGLGRFFPDELPLLGEMGRLSTLAVATGDGRIDGGLDQKEPGEGSWRDGR